MYRHEIIDEDFFDSSIDSQADLIEAFGIGSLSSEDASDDIGVLSKCGERGQHVAVALMACDDVTGLYLAIEEDGLLGEQFWNAFPGDIARDVAQTGGPRWEGPVCELLSLFPDLFLQVVESQLRLHLGDTHVLVLLGVSVDFLEGVEVPVGLLLGAVLVLGQGLDLIFVFRLLALTAPHRFKDDDYILFK